MRAGQRIALFAVVVSSLLTILALEPSAAYAKRKKGAARAEPAAAAVDTGPSAEAKERARSAYGRGQEAFSGGNFATAKIAFEEAFEAVPNPIVLLSIAESQVKLEQFAEAIATWQHYLEMRPDASDRADIETKIKTLNAMPAVIAVTSDPSGANLDLDGLPTQRTTPAQVEMGPGEHTLDYSLSGHQGGSEKLSVKPGEKRELHLTLTALDPERGLEQMSAQAGSEAAPPAASSDDSSAGPPTTAIWVTAGVGAAGLIAGSVFGMLAVQEHSDFDEKPTTASADRGERYALFADVGFGVGIIALTTAAVLYLTADDAESGQSAKLVLTPALSPTSFAARARLRF